MKRWVLARLLWVRKATYRVTVLAYLTQPGPVKEISTRPPCEFSPLEAR